MWDLDQKSTWGENEENLRLDELVVTCSCGFISCNKRTQTNVMNVINCSLIMNVINGLINVGKLGEGGVETLPSFQNVSVNIEL